MNSGGVFFDDSGKKRTGRDSRQDAINFQNWKNAEKQN
jgi:hypothetical protein